MDFLENLNEQLAQISDPLSKEWERLLNEVSREERRARRRRARAEASRRATGADPAPTPAAPTSAPAQPAPEESAQLPPEGQQHQYNSGVKNIHIVKQAGDNALVRVRGLDKNTGKAIFKYFTVDPKTLMASTGSDAMEPENIWKYIFGAFKSGDSKEFNKKFVSNMETATQRFQQLSGQIPERPENFNAYLRQTVGQTHKDMLLNAMKRMKVNSRLVDLAVELDDNQVADLLASYRNMPGINRRFGVVDKKVGGWLEQQSRRFNPMESEDIDPYAELLVEGPILTSIGRKLSGIGKRIQDRLTSDDVKLARKAVEYEILARAISDNPQRYVDELRKVGLKYRTEEPQQMQKSSEKEALGGAVEDFGKAVEAIPGHSEEDIEKVSQSMGKAVEAMPGDTRELASTGRAPQSQVAQEAGRMLSYLKSSPAMDRILQSVIPDAHHGLLTKYVSPALSAASDKEAQAILKQMSGRDWQALKQYLHTAMSHMSALSQGQAKPRKLRMWDRLRKWGKGAWNRLRGTRRESYARAISNNIQIEEARLAANDRAQLALQIYAEECNSLNRLNIPKIFNEEREEHFNQTLAEAVEYAQEFARLLNEQGLELEIVEPVPECWFESLVNLIEQTANPLDRIEVDDVEMVLESYQKEYLSIVERKEVGYIPLSKIT